MYYFSYYFLPTMSNLPSFWNPYDLGAGPPGPTPGLSVSSPLFSDVMSVLSEMFPSLHLRLLPLTFFPLELL